MNSGIYSALSGARSRMQLLEVVSNNLANVNTVGFKKDRLNFESLISDARQQSLARGVNHSRVGLRYTDHGTGTFQTTGNNLDLAINGPGFFKVQTPEGEAYTRQGSFRLNAEGTLVTAAGYPVVGANGPVNLPDADVVIDESGRILDGEAIVGEIAVFDVLDPQQLEKRGDGLFAAAEPAGETRVANPGLAQGQLESSNVNPLEEMAVMIDAQRNFEALTRAIKSYKEMGKAAELGRVG
ncbi:MAG: flagellar basal-body rod protein FlgF [Thermodesulfobacteriota bacterium]|nr:flagellar basal-body rod protein FlgF [Thermodesulfobacteriota bacterium]